MAARPAVQHTVFYTNCQFALGPVNRICMLFWLTQNAGSACVNVCLQYFTITFKLKKKAQTVVLPHVAWNWHKGWYKYRYLLLRHNIFYWTFLQCTLSPTGFAKWIALVLNNLDLNKQNKLFSVKCVFKKTNRGQQQSQSATFYRQPWQLDSEIWIIHWICLNLTDE